MLVVTGEILDICEWSLVNAGHLPAGLKFGAQSRILFVFSFYV
jgi:hypothetical protein